MSQRHEDYYGFVKTGFKKVKKEQEISEHHFGATWSILVPFLTPSDFEGGSKINYFWKQSKKNEKNEVQETALKKHDFWLIFDAKMRGLKL